MLALKFFFALGTSCLFSATPFISSAQSGQAGLFSENYYKTSATAAHGTVRRQQYACSHPTYPVGTHIKIVNDVNNQMVIAKVVVTRPATNKKGLIDITPKIAEALSIVKTAKVTCINADDAPIGPVSVLQPDNERIVMNKVTNITEAIANDTLNASIIMSPDVVPKAVVVPSAPVKIYKMEVEQFTAMTGYAVQVGALSQYDKAMQLLQDLRKKHTITNILITNPCAATDNLFKVFVGPYDDIATAKAMVKILKSYHQVPFLIDLTTLRIIKISDR